MTEKMLTGTLNQLRRDDMTEKMLTGTLNHKSNKQTHNFIGWRSESVIS